MLFLSLWCVRHTCPGESSRYISNSSRVKHVLVQVRNDIANSFRRHRGDEIRRRSNTSFHSHPITIRRVRILPSDLLRIPWRRRSFRTAPEKARAAEWANVRLPKRWIVTVRRSKRFRTSVFFLSKEIIVRQYGGNRLSRVYCSITTVFAYCMKYINWLLIFAIRGDDGTRVCNFYTIRALWIRVSYTHIYIFF